MARSNRRQSIEDDLAAQGIDVTVTRIWEAHGGLPEEIVVQGSYADYLLAKQFFAARGKQVSKHADKY